jgi:hypothetical protein
MNVEIGAEAALFPEKDYIKGIFVAVEKKQAHIFNNLSMRRSRNMHLSTDYKYNNKKRLFYEEHLTFVVRIQTNNTVCNNLTKHFSLQDQLCLTFVII